MHSLFPRLQTMVVTPNALFVVVNLYNEYNSKCTLCCRDSKSNVVVISSTKSTYTTINTLEVRKQFSNRKETGSKYMTKIGIYFPTNSSHACSDPGGYWWPPTYSKWLLVSVFVQHILLYCFVIGGSTPLGMFEAPHILQVDTCGLSPNPTGLFCMFSCQHILMYFQGHFGALNVVFFGSP
jgi:hypothetical protein